MRSLSLAVLLPVTVLASMTGCDRRRVQRSTSADLHYTLGPAWLGDDCWFYPKEESSYVATGLAVVDASRPQQKRRTADGELYDPAALTASHQTLQLPVVLRVRNLENGRVLTLRVNDRGPASPKRLLSMTPGAARVMGMIPGHATRIQVAEDETLSHAILRQVNNAPVADVTAAPVTAVQEQSLTSPITSDASGKASPSPPRESDEHPGETTLGALMQGPADPGQLWIDAGHFSRRIYARRLASALAGTVRQEGRGQSVLFSVRLGPFGLVTQADAALDRARSGGVTDARIIVE